jgi:hypothetical protein
MKLVWNNEVLAFYAVVQRMPFFVLLAGPCLRYADELC